MNPTGYHLLICCHGWGRRYVLRRPVSLAEQTTNHQSSQRWIIAFVNTNLARQFEFVQSQWVNDGDFISTGHDKDPIAGNQREEGEFTIPGKPIRQRLTGIPSFVVTKGGEHVFLPGIGGLRWLAEGRW